MGPVRPKLCEAATYHIPGPHSRATFPGKEAALAARVVCEPMCGRSEASAGDASGKNAVIPIRPQARRRFVASPDATLNGLAKRRPLPRLRSAPRFIDTCERERNRAIG